MDLAFKRGRIMDLLKIQNRKSCIALTSHKRGWNRSRIIVELVDK